MSFPDAPAVSEIIPPAPPLIPPCGCAAAAGQGGRDDCARKGGRTEEGRAALNAPLDFSFLSTAVFFSAFPGGFCCRSAASQHVFCVPCTFRRLLPFPPIFVCLLTRTLSFLFVFPLPPDLIPAAFVVFLPQGFVPFRLSASPPPSFNVSGSPFSRRRYKVFNKNEFLFQLT